MTRVITVLNQKGGVGKSTATVNLAAVRAHTLTAHLDPDAFSPVAAVSIDPQGSAKWWANRVDALPFHLVQAHDDPLDWLRQLNNLPSIAEVYVDTAGWFDLDPDSSVDGLGDGYSADALRTVLDITDEAIVPILPAPMCFDPTARTIRKLLEPRDIPYRVFINDWDPRDGDHWLEETQKFVRGQGWPLAATVIRHYKIHTNASNEGIVVTQYKKSGSAGNAAADFFALADELNMVGGALMGRGGVTTFDNLVDAVGDNSSVDGQAHTPVVAPRSGLSRSVSLRELVGNPHNPRSSLGDLEDLASIADVQLQPVVVVTRGAFNTIYPDTKISARWVVIIGNRRLAAAKKFGRAELDIVIKDELVKDRPTLKAAVISENVDRKGFDVIEEARAVEDLVEDLGSADLAAKYLSKSKGWVSQRRALLQLVPDLQEALRQGDLAIREARSLARVPLEQQVARWNAARDPKPERDTDEGSGAPGSGSASAPHSLRSVTKALRKFDSEPHSLALALLDELGEAGVKTLASQLRKLTK